MKKFIMFVVLLIAFVVWAQQWITSGKMDEFIRQNRDPQTTPTALYWLGKISDTLNISNSSVHYFRWLVDEYPDDPRMAEIRWKLGKSYEDIHRRDLAIEQYIILKDSFSATNEGQLAQNRWQMMR